MFIRLHWNREQRREKTEGRRHEELVRDYGIICRRLRQQHGFGPAAAV
jgi:hypothetical protein